MKIVAVVLQRVQAQVQILRNDFENWVFVCLEVFIEDFAFTSRALIKRDKAQPEAMRSEFWRMCMSRDIRNSRDSDSRKNIGIVPATYFEE
jgi:hypothetical protein